MKNTPRYDVAELKYTDKAGTHSFTVEVVHLDAEGARSLLEFNTHNRSPKKGKQREYLSDMLAGRWRFNGESLKIDKNGVLLDGQNRLMALAQTDGSVILPFLLVSGLEPESQKTMDQPAKRTAYDQLLISNIDSNRTIAAAVRFYIQWDRLAFFGGRDAAVTNTEIVEWAETNPTAMELLWSLYHDGFATKISGELAVRQGVLLAAALRFSELDFDDMEQFFTFLHTGADMSIDHPVLTLRTRLARHHHSQMKLKDQDQAALLVQSWNAFRSGRSLAKLQRPRGNVWTADNFPKPL